MERFNFVLLIFLLPVVVWAEAVSIKVDCGKVEHTMAGGIGASWHAMSKEFPVDPNEKKWRTNVINARGSAWGGNPPIEWEDSWEQVCRHASWLGMNWIRVEFSQRMYEPERKKFDWDNDEMRALYRILDWCENNKVDVFLTQMWSYVDWNTIGDVHPLQSAPRSIDDFAEGLATLMEYLVKEKGYTCIRWLCISNEPNHKRGWWLKGFKQPDSIEPALRAVRKELDKRGISVPLSAPDWNVPVIGFEHVFDVDSDVKVGAYDVHNYRGPDPQRMAMMDEWVKLARERGVPFFLTELGDNNCKPHNSWAAVLSNTETVLKGMNLGIDAFNRWSFTNRGDLDGEWQMVRTWDTDKKQYIRKIDPELLSYYGWAILTRFNSKYSDVLATEIDNSEEIIAAALRSPGGHLTTYILNKSANAQDVAIDIKGLEESHMFYRYQVTEKAVSTDGFRLDPGHKVKLSAEESTIKEKLPARSITAYSMYRLYHTDPGVIGDDYYAGIKEAAVKELAAITSGKKPYLKPGDWKPVDYAANAPFKGVSIDSGPLRVCFDRNIEYLNRYFNKRYKEVKAPLSGWEKKLPGSSEGRLLGGAGHTLRWGERADMREIVDTVVGIVKERQAPDGYCLPYNESLMEGSHRTMQDERRNYDRVNLTRGMIAAGMAGNADAYGIMRKFYDWLNASPYYPRLLAGQFENGSSHNCNNGHEGGLLMYFSPVGKDEDLVAVERYFVQDFFIEESRKAEPLSLCWYPFNTPHCYVILAYQAWLDHYRATGAVKYLDAAKGAWKIVHDWYVHTGGTIAICEEPPGAYPPGSYFLHKHTGETCGSVFWADFNHRFLRFFPDEAKYADEIERVIFNVILATQGVDGGIRYHNHLVGKKQGAGSYNSCCEVMGSPFIARLPQYVYSMDDEGLFVNLFSASTINWKHDGQSVTLKTTTEFPFDGRVLLEVGVIGKMKLRIRVPGWVESPVEFRVNGKSLAEGKPGSYVVLDREWEKGDSVDFELPMTFRVIQYTGQEQDQTYKRYALLRGPVLMALTGGTDLDVPADKLPSLLESADNQPLHFRVAGSDFLYMPYWEIQEEEFTCFPTMR